jgi:hypothetical protein
MKPNKYLLIVGLVLLLVAGAGLYKLGVLGCFAGSILNATPWDHNQA